MTEYFSRCQLVDFHRPTSANGSHPELFNWVRQYFEAHDDFKPPLYLQHQGELMYWFVNLFAVILALEQFNLLKPTQKNILN